MSREWVFLLYLLFCFACLVTAVTVAPVAVGPVLVLTGAWGWLLTRKGAHDDEP